MASLPQATRTTSTAQAGPSAVPPEQTEARRRAEAAASTPVSRHSLLRWTILGVLLMGAIAALASAPLAAWWQAAQSWFASDTDQRPVTATVMRASVPIVIHAGGELESSAAEKTVCELEGSQAKIVEMIPEGTAVEQGQVVIRLDPSEINDRLAAQQIQVTQVDAEVKAAAEELKIQRNLAASQIAQAELALTLAELDKEKYTEGDYSVEMNGLRGSIALAKTELQDAEDTVEFYRSLVKKGFRTPEQLRTKEQEVERAQYDLSRDEQKLHVLEQYTRKRQVAELSAKAEEAQRELERAKSSTAAQIVKAETDLEVASATAQLEREQLDRMKQQLEYCTVRAAADGTVVYAKDKSKRIELGELVDYKQKLFSVPDMSQMQVNAFVHESEVKKVRPGMRAEIRVDAVPKLVLEGSVEQVADFYDSTRQWLSGGVKDYETVVRIAKLPDVGLKPGMTTQVKLFVGQLSESLLVPIPAVAEHQGNYYCFVVEDGGIRRRKVSIGASTENLVGITVGLREGEQVVLDARQRAASELRDKERTEAAPSESLTSLAVPR